MNHIEQTILNLVSKDLRIEAAYILGSAARGTMRPDSDIDVAVLPAANCGLNDLARLEIGAELSYMLDRAVDVGVVSSGNLVYAREAILTGRRIYERNRTVADTVVANLLGMYAAFNEERREVVDAYTA